MAKRAFTLLTFVAERIRMICLALVLIVIVKIAGASLLARIAPPPSPAAIAQPRAA